MSPVSISFISSLVQVLLYSVTPVGVVGVHVSSNLPYICHAHLRKLTKVESRFTIILMV
jgi:hypothetical protein